MCSPLGSPSFFFPCQNETFDVRRIGCLLIAAALFFSLYMLFFGLLFVFLAFSCVSTNPWVLRVGSSTEALRLEKRHRSLSFR